MTTCVTEYKIYGLRPKSRELKKLNQKNNQSAWTQLKYGIHNVRSLVRFKEVEREKRHERGSLEYTQLIRF